MYYSIYREHNIVKLFKCDTEQTFDRFLSRLKNLGIGSSIGYRNDEEEINKEYEETANYWNRWL